MSITSSTGLISGIDIASLVKQLMAIEAKPLTALQTRITNIQQEQAAYQAVGGRITSLNAIISRLSQTISFQARTATSSQPTVMTATADNSAPLGAYSFLVQSVVSTHQMASSGFADHDLTPVGAGTLTFEPVQARVDNDTELSSLNGGDGVHRGMIRITDRSGASAKIDLRTVRTMGDVLDAINSQSEIAVRAHLKGDRLVIEDQTGLSTGTLSVSEVSGGVVAGDLGIVGFETGDGKVISNHDLVRLTGTTQLATLNDGLGVRLGGGQFDFSTSLTEINGGTPMGAGTLHITNKSGLTQDLELTGTETFRDINTKLASEAYKELKVQISSVSSSGGIVLTDSSGGSGQFTIEDAAGAIGANLKIIGQTGSTTLGGGYIGGKSDLRFTLADGRVFEVDLTSLFNMDTSLSELNAGQGVGAGTLRITNTEGLTQELQLSGSETLNDIRTKLASDEYRDLGVQVASASGSGTITFSDNSTGSGKFKIEDVSGSIAAQLKLTNQADNSISGKANYQFSTINNVIRKTQYARDTAGNLNGGAFEIALAADGKSLTIIDHTTGGTATSAMDLNGSNALADLGLTGTFNAGVLTGGRVVSGVNTVLLSTLNGGAGVRLGVTQFQLRDGTTRSVDFTGAQTLQDVIGTINEQSSLRAEVSAGGTGMVITDDTTGAGTLSISGDTATDLHFSGTSVNNQLKGGDLNRKYISESSLLSKLNGGKGIGLTAGNPSPALSFQITNSAGASTTVTLSGSMQQTIGDVINAINRAVGAHGVEARVNSNGDGIELREPTAVGAGRLSVTEVGTGNVASALHLLGEASTDQPGVITGSFAGNVDIQGSDTLDDLIAKINKANVGVQASLINDGSSTNPYRLVITSSTSGTAGEIAYSGNSVSFETLTEARDARIVVGSVDSPNAIIINSSSNKVTGVAQGVTLNLLAASDTPVEVSVTQSADSVAADLGSFVESYNAILDQIDQLTQFDAATNTKGILLGDSTIHRVRDVLYREVSRSLPSGYGVKRLTSIGITYGKGGRLQVDDQKFRSALADDPQGVQDLFTKVTTTKDAAGKEKVQYVGIAASLKEALKNLAISSDSVLRQEDQRLSDQIDLYNQRATAMQTLLNSREQQYYKQFQAMESALAKMQSQSSSLTALSNLASSMSASSKTTA